jgi:hypothetical protein
MLITPEADFSGAEKATELGDASVKVGRVPAGCLMSGQAGSTLLVRVEDVVLRLHGRMARVSAV